MRLETVKTAEIKPYENNPRFNDNAVDAVAESIRQCTYIQPIIVDEDYVVLAGHTRLKALNRLGVLECQVLVCEGLTEEQKRKFRYLDNKTGEAAVWDIAKLEEEIEDLDLGELDFFTMTAEDYTVNVPGDIEGSEEIDISDFEEQGFKYECPECGFRFN